MHRGAIPRSTMRNGFGTRPPSPTRLRPLIKPGFDVKFAPRSRRPAKLRVLCDGQFTLWVNGQLVGHGSAKQLYRFNLNGVVGRGPNIVAVEVETLARQGGLFVDGEIRGESGTSTTFDTGGEWFATTTPVSGAAWLAPHFDVSTWKPARVIGQHAQSPWSSIVLKESDFDQFDVPAGFELSRAADPQMVGSLIAMTWGNRGRLIVSRENGPILSLIDDNGDGVYDLRKNTQKSSKTVRGFARSATPSMRSARDPGESAFID